MNEQNQQMTKQTTEMKDLTVTTADLIKGGPKRIFVGSLSVAGQQTTLPDLEPRGEVEGGHAGFTIKFNNNETVVSEADEAGTKNLDDLPIAEAVAAEVKGGPGSGNNGGVWLNHNETIATDEDDETATTEPLPDLAVSDEQAEQTQGGLKWERLRVPFA